MLLNPQTRNPGLSEPGYPVEFRLLRRSVFNENMLVFNWKQQFSMKTGWFSIENHTNNTDNPEHNPG